MISLESNQMTSTYFESVVDSSTTIQYTEHFTGLATDVEREREIEQMIKSKLGHGYQSSTRQEIEV
jgi:hypothetical protein